MSLCCVVVPMCFFAPLCLSVLGSLLLCVVASCCHCGVVVLWYAELCLCVVSFCRRVFLRFCVFVS